MYLRQSTASQEILLGRFVDSTDGDTEMTGLTIANTDIKIWKHGATTLANKNSGGATHIANGMYYAVLDATDTDTIGNLEVNVHVATALSVRREFIVLDEAVYDVLFGTTALATGTIPTATQNADALLNRDMSAVSDTNSRSPLNALRFLRNFWSLSGGTLTVKKEDDSTNAWTATVTSDAGADPVTGVDPG